MYIYIYIDIDIYLPPPPPATYLMYALVHYTDFLSEENRVTV